MSYDPQKSTNQQEPNRHLFLQIFIVIGLSVACFSYAAVTTSPPSSQPYEKRQERTGVISGIDPFAAADYDAESDATSLPSEVRKAASFWNTISITDSKIIKAISKIYKVAPEGAYQVVKIVHEESVNFPNVNPMLFLGLIGVESRFNPFAMNGGARGLTQGMPSAHPEKMASLSSPEKIVDIRENIRFGMKVLSEYQARYKDEGKALQAYKGDVNDPQQAYAGLVYRAKARLQNSMAML